MNGISALIKGTQRVLTPLLCEDTANIGVSMSWEAGPHQIPNLLAP